MYEVYVCKLNDEVLYVGQGKLGRHNHCKSGCSHVYELNKLHFLGEKIEVRIVNYFDSRDESLACEKELIKKLYPKFNIKHTIREGDVATTKKFVSKFTNTLVRCGYRVCDCDKVFKLLDEFLVYYSISEIQSGDFAIYSNSFYKSRSSMLLLSRYLRYDIGHKSSYFCNIFSEVFKVLCGYSLHDKIK